MRIPFLNLQIHHEPRSSTPLALETKQQSPPVGTLASPPTGRGGWWPLVREAFAGAWQRNISVGVQDVMTYSTVWACATLRASDISKLSLKLIERSERGGIEWWTPTTSPSFSPVLDKPNHYSTRIKFIEYWMLSKLLHGNTYVLKERDNRGTSSRFTGTVVALYVLDPTQVKVLIAPDGSVYYAVGRDALSGQYDASNVLPASEIIHDLCVPLYHPLVGVSPIHACAMNALAGLKAQEMATTLFANGANPGGVITAPHPIPGEIVDRIRNEWETNYSGQQNAGKVVVLSDSMEYKPLTMSFVDAQLVDQLKWGDERICACFHVPGYMVGIGGPPPYTDIQSLMLQYYTQALQADIENLEILLAEGLALPAKYAVEVDLDALLRMDTKTQVENSTKGISGGLFKPNEERAKFNREPVDGGDTVYMQQQQFSLAALDKRDQAEPAPSSLEGGPPRPQLTDGGRVDEDDENEEEAAAMVEELWICALDSTELWRKSLEAA